MATNPLKTVADIDGVLEELHATSADSVVSVVRIWDHHPSRVKYIEKGRLVDFYPEVPESRRQDLTPPAYVRNGSIYATTMDSFLKHRVRLGPDTRPYIMPESRTVNIDEPIDLELARILLK
jgi:CMP-N-acetylneuraminic acid synthetase